MEIAVAASETNKCSATLVMVGLQPDNGIHSLLFLIRS
jgi:hypothetical protein